MRRSHECHSCGVAATNRSTFEASNKPIVAHVPVFPESVRTRPSCRTLVLINQHPSSSGEKCSVRGPGKSRTLRSWSSYTPRLQPGLSTAPKENYSAENTTFPVHPRSRPALCQLVVGSRLYTYRPYCFTAAACPSAKTALAYPLLVALVIMWR